MGVTAESEYPTRIIIEDEEAPIHTTTTSSHRHRCCFPSTTSFWKCIPRAAESQNNNHPSWWGVPIRAFKKLREWSEIIAGPKWKTFIRRFNRRDRHRSHQSKFQYDPLSYALNFDDPGQIGQFEGDDSGQVPDFSSRFAAAVSHSSKSSVDSGN